MALPARSDRRSWYHRNVQDSFKTLQRPDLMRRFQETMELFETAVAIQRQNLRRRHPDLSEEEIEGRVQEWLLDRRGDHSSPDFRRSTRWSHLVRA